MSEETISDLKSDFRVVPKRKLSEAEKHMLLLTIEKMKLQREKALIILGGSIMLFIAFIVVAIVGVLNELITKNMLNLLVTIGLASLIVGIIPYAKFVMKEEKSLERTLNELTT